MANAKLLERGLRVDTTRMGPVVGNDGDAVLEDGCAGLARYQPSVPKALRTDIQRMGCAHDRGV